MNTFFYSFLISATMRITSWFWRNLQNISQTNPLHATGMLWYCSGSLKKQVQLQMCHNLGGLVWHQCGRIWKMGPPLRWKMQTPPHVTYPQYLDHFAKCSNTWGTTSPRSSLLFFTFDSPFLPLVFSHVQMRELTLAAPCICTSQTFNMFF